MKFSHKLVLTSTLIATGAIAALSTVLYINSYNETTTTVEKRLQSTATSMADHIGTWVSGKETLILTLQQGISQSTNDQQIQKLIDLPILKQEFSVAYLGLEDRPNLIINYPFNKKGYDARKRSWYKEARAKGGINVKNPYLDTKTGKLMLAIGTPLTDSRGINGVVNGKIELDSLLDILDKHPLGDAGYAFLITGQGKIISHPDTSFNGKTVADLFTNRPTLSSTIQKTMTTTEEQALTFSSVSVEGIDWKVGVVINHDKAYAGVYQLRNMAIFFTIGTALTCLFIYQLIISRLLLPMKTIGNAMKQIGSGQADLSQRIPANSGDEFQELAEDFNHFMSSLQNLVHQIQDMGGSLLTSSSQAQQIAGDAAGHINQQQQETDQLATAMNEMAASAAEVAQNAQLAAQHTAEASQNTVVGREVVADTSATIDQLAKQLEQAHHSVNLLAEHSEGIESITSVISSIAEQTNLLALNAAIEAARAGEQGRGFAVVADEVRSLASRTQDATREIKTMIGELREKTEQTVLVIESSGTSAYESVKKAEQARNALEQISGTIEQISGMNIQIASAAEQQSSVTEEINQNAVAIRDASSAFTQSASDVDRISQSLLDQSQQQQKLLGQFSH
ncbi:methyl-accepting chemotaxis protein [Pelagibaculum spongiae]|uniref:Methyl-accepting chemotaxis protein n=1 Tax=Pelagibaculum spongiae TaxID=2080658 RepID=A0A2V1H566_9GAMM|nr:methyl-accepting chemotaxis protein [Pelagibaculum spongiae]PVZ71552.1 hypothetical protein DC094_00475 [Pelagibaculum spongiae]